MTRVGSSTKWTCHRLVCGQVFPYIPTSQLLGLECTLQLSNDLRGFPSAHGSHNHNSQSSEVASAPPKLIYLGILNPAAAGASVSEPLGSPGTWGARERNKMPAGPTRAGRSTEDRSPGCRHCIVVKGVSALLVRIAQPGSILGFPDYWVASHACASPKA
jgi:hypothetical protein